MIRYPGDSAALGVLGVAAGGTQLVVAYPWLFPVAVVTGCQIVLAAWFVGIGICLFLQLAHASLLTAWRQPAAVLDRWPNATVDVQVRPPVRARRVRDAMRRMNTPVGRSFDAAAALLIVYVRPIANSALCTVPTFDSVQALG